MMPAAGRSHRTSPTAVVQRAEPKDRRWLSSAAARRVEEDEARNQARICLGWTRSGRWLELIFTIGDPIAPVSAAVALAPAVATCKRSLGLLDHVAWSRTGDASEDRTEVELTEEAQPARTCPLTEAAFAELRSTFGSAKAPRPTALQYADEFVQMPFETIDHWCDGNQDGGAADVPSRLTVETAREVRLWVVTEKDVLHARKFSDFGVSRPRGELKHTNLTGGSDAYCGGELFIVDPSTVVVNGDSGRYGPQEQHEKNAVFKAFADSGHRTFTTGYDADTDLPLPLIGYDLERVS